MGILDAFKETPAITIEVPQLYKLLDRSSRLRYLEKAVECDLELEKIKQIFLLPDTNGKEKSNGDIERGS